MSEGPMSGLYKTFIKLLTIQSYIQKTITSQPWASISCLVDMFILLELGDVIISREIRFHHVHQVVIDEYLGLDSLAMTETTVEGK